MHSMHVYATMHVPTLLVVNNVAVDDVSEDMVKTFTSVDTAPDQSLVPKL